MATPLSIRGLSRTPIAIGNQHLDINTPITVDIDDPIVRKDLERAKGLWYPDVNAQILVESDSIALLNDVDLSTPPTNGQVLTYIAADDMWKAHTPDVSDLDDDSSYASLGADQTFAGSNTFDQEVLASTAPSDPAALTNKEYVDGLVSDAIGSLTDDDSGFVSAGSENLWTALQTFQSGMNAGGNVIANVGNPADPNDAATQGSVETYAMGLGVANTITGINEFQAQTNFKNGGFIFMEGTGPSALFSTAREFDAAHRFEINRDGSASWGGGSDPADVTLSRTDVGILSIGDGFLQSSAVPQVDDDYTNKLYVDTAISGITDDDSTFELSSNKSTDDTLADNSATLYPSQSAVKGYVDTAISGVTPSKNGQNAVAPATSASTVTCTDTSWHDIVSVTLTGDGTTPIEVDAWTSSVSLSPNASFRHRIYNSTDDVVLSLATVSHPSGTGDYGFYAAAPHKCIVPSFSGTKTFKFQGKSSDGTSVTVNTGASAYSGEPGNTNEYSVMTAKWSM